jgi:hypothetical protein
MKSAKQILRQELGVALLEFKTGGGNYPEKASYAVNSRHTPRIYCFDDLASALSYFDDEIRHFRESLAFRNWMPPGAKIAAIAASRHSL